MKRITQNLRWLVTLLAMIVSTGAWAEETITLSEQGYTDGEEVSSTVGTDFTITYNKGTSTAAPKYYNTGEGVRVYAGGNVVVSSEKIMTKVVFTYTKNNSPTVEIGNKTVSSPATWEGSAKSVQLDVNTKGHIRLQSVTVTFEDDGEATLITIAEARALGTGSVYTSGVVTSCVGTNAYIQDATAAICVYGNANLVVGNEITVQGTLTTYNGLLEIMNPTCTVVSSGNSISPTVKTIAEINTDYAGNNELQGVLVKIENATVNAKDGQNTTIAQGNNTIVVRGISSNVTFGVGDVITLTGNVGCYNAVQIVNPTDVEVSQLPSITLSTNAINVSAEGGDGTIEVNRKYFEPESFEIKFYESDGTTETEGGDWLYVEIDENTGNINYIIEENAGEARSAYFKVYGMDEEMNELYSELITVTQAAYVAPSIAALPFAFNDGRADIEGTDGLTQEGLDKDYAISPKLKFDSTGDWVLLQFDEAPGDLSFDIKGYSFSGGTFKVQTSVDGNTYTDLKTYTDLGNTQSSEVFKNLNENVRYIKWIYTNNVSGNVGLGNISLTKYVAPQPYTMTITPNNNATIKAFYYNDVNDFIWINNGDEVLSRTKVYIAVHANNNYEAKSVTVTDANNVNVTVTKEPVYDENIDPVWSFTMPESNVTVSCKVKEIVELKFEKVTSTDGLFEGGDYIIVNEENSKAMSTTQNSNNRGAAEIILDNGTATIGEDTQIFTLEGGSDGWYFNTGSGYIYAASSSSNQLKTGTEKNNNAKATITINNGTTSVVFNRKDGRNTLQYNPNNGNPLFTCYASASQEPIQLYKKVGQSPITIDENTTLAVGKYATRIYPFAPKAIEGITFYSCKAVNGTSLALTPVTELKANTPYILGNDGEGATEAISIKQTGVDKHEEDTYTEGYLTGVFATTTVPEGSYVLQTQNEKQAFYKVEGEFTINTPYRAYLTVPTDVAGNVKAFNLGVDDATAINTLDVLTSGAYEGIYSVDGVKLNRMEKGVNILKMADGTTRKVIVK